MKRKKLSIKPKCTCGAKHGRHRLSCDLFYAVDRKLKRKHRYPKKRKRFFLFYPLKEKK